MSKLEVDAIEPQSGTTLTLGASGDTVALSDNLLFNTASKGIYLGVTTATASNLLDDYEEGTWTPDFGNIAAPTYTSRSGRYTKIGRIVYCTGEVVVSSLDNTDGSAYAIGGLPFTGNFDEEALNFTLGRYIDLLGPTTNQQALNNVRFAGSSVLLLKSNNDSLSYSSGASSGTLQFAFTYAT